MLEKSMEGSFASTCWADTRFSFTPPFKPGPATSNTARIISLLLMELMGKQECRGKMEIPVSVGNDSLNCPGQVEAMKSGKL